VRLPVAVGQPRSPARLAGRGANRQGLACSSGRPRRRRPRLRASVAGRAPRRPWTS